ncbi:MAG: sugar ABC transporter permease, partial [Clostridia bacterium]|nr:sugar ABC transporter permease [Clostridia bacterium]
MAKHAVQGRSLRERMNHPNVVGYVFILPFITGLLVFTVIPFFTSLYLAFTEYNILSPAKWVGLKNFHKMFFEDKLFWTSFWVTFKFALIQVPIKLTVSLLVALVLSKTTRLTGYYRAAFYIPSLMGSSVAIALLWKQLFAFNGVINQVLGLLGLPDNQRWLGDPKTALGVLISLGVWQFGSSMLIFLAAIKNIPASFHE